jgi:hypothetical protein
VRVCVLAPSPEYLGQAGVRIRYMRISEQLRALGHELTVQVIDHFQSPEQFTHDAYVFSKCYDARCFVIGHLLRAHGRLIGVDMFDDYFSQHGNSRFVGQREWLRGLAEFVDFFLCSTPRMKDVAASYLPGTPGHILNDPFDAFDADAIGRISQANLDETLRRRCIEVAWFGVGDNPHVAVGLRDLHAFGEALALLGRSGMEVNLRILTNRRALGVEGLEMLGRLPVRWSVDEWTVDAERELLGSSLVAFIPVNAQQFSIAKSLNRAVSALTSGTQVLSTGFPLYAPLGQLVYRSAQALLDDLAARRLLLGPHSLPLLRELMTELGDPGQEARACAGFLAGVLAARAGATGLPADAPTLALVHGVRSPAAVHKFTQRIRQLSVASPFCTNGLNYDMRFSFGGDAGEVQVQFSEAARAHVRPELQGRLVRGVSALGRTVRCLPLDALAPELARVLAIGLRCRSRAEQLAAYDDVMLAVAAAVSRLTDVQVLQVSESEPPFLAPRLTPAPALAMAEG